MDDHLLIAIHYFEIGSLFKGTDASLKAIDLSLSEMAKVRDTPASGPPIAAVPKAAPTPNRCAEIAFSENMGYVISDLCTGAPIHSNVATTWGDVPPELTGKQYTQVVGKKSSPVVARFLTPGTMYVLVFPNFPEVYTANAKLLSTCGKKLQFQLRGTPDPKLAAEVWSITGQAGQTITFPTQIILVAEKLSRIEKK
jgi:hypothetical protein